MDTQEPSKERPSSANPGPPGANAAYPPPAYQQPANAFYGPTAHTQYPGSHPMQNTVYTQYPAGHPMQNTSYTQYPAGHPMQNTSYTQFTASHPMQNAVYPAGQNLVVTTQPMTIVSTTQAYTSDYLGYSIFTMLCCCLPLGIAALVFSLQAREANNRGDAAQARSSSRTALTINNVALGLGIAITVSWVAYVIYVNVAVRKYFVNYSYSSG